MIGGTARGYYSDPQFRYPEEVVRLAIGLVYGEPGWCLREASYALGIPQSTIGVCKKRYVDGGVMEIPELDPNEIPSKSWMVVRSDLGGH